MPLIEFHVDVPDKNHFLALASQRKMNITSTASAERSAAQNETHLKQPQS